MKTWVPKLKDMEEKGQSWWVFDAADKTVGRLSTEIANVLRGKNKPEFTPHADMGDFVVVINSDKVKFTGKKWLQKKYYSRSRYFGSLKEMTAKELLEKDSPEIIYHAVRGMLPKNKLASKLIKKLHVYSGTEHPHTSQKPQAYSINQ